MNKDLLQLYLSGYEKQYFTAGSEISKAGYADRSWYETMTELEDEEYPDNFNRWDVEEWERAKTLRREIVMKQLKDRAND